jgi:hypothetical protein
MNALESLYNKRNKVLARLLADVIQIVVEKREALQIEFEFFAQLICSI